MAYPSSSGGVADDMRKRSMKNIRSRGPSMSKHDDDIFEKEDVLETFDMDKIPRTNIFWNSVIFIIVVEAANMFAFYGGLKDWMNWYVGAYLGIGNTDAQTLYMAYQSFTYIMPILSGIVADTFLGPAKTLYFAGIVYVLGLLILLISTIINERLSVAGGTAENPNQAGVILYFIGSFVAAFGAGAIKPAVVVLGADQYDADIPEEATQRGSYYTLFYVTVQVGSFVAGYFPMLVKHDDNGPMITIAITTSMLIASLIILFSFRKRFIVKPCQGSETLEVAQVIGSAFARFFCPCFVSKNVNRGRDESSISRTQSFAESQAPKQPRGFLDRASVLFGGRFSHDRVLACKQIIRMLPLWSTQIITFLVYFQGATYWVAQGWQMDDQALDINTIQSVFDPLFCMTFMLIIRFVFTHPAAPIAKWLAKRGWQLTGLRQMGIGIIPFTLAILSAGLIEEERMRSPLLYNSTGGVQTSQYGAPVHQISAFYMLIPIALCSLGESFCFVGIVDFFYSEAPEGLKTISTALGMFASAVASWVGIVFSQAFKGWVGDNLDDSRLAEYNYIITGISVGNFLWFLLAAFIYRITDPKRSKERELPNMSANVKGGPLRRDSANRSFIRQ